MKLLLRRNVYKLGKIGEVVEVKVGYARNYLLPHHLAVEPTEGNLKAVEAEKEKYLAELAKIRSELEAKAAVVNGKEVTISARANDEGVLYGSVGPAQIIAALAEQNILLDEAFIELDRPIRNLDTYEVTLRFNEEVAAKISVRVVPIHVAEEAETVEKPAETEAPPAE